MTPDLTVKKKKSRRLWRWLRNLALALLMLFVVSALTLWLRLQREESRGRDQLAAVIAETDERDPRWRWEEIQEDLAPIPENENSTRIVQQFTDSLGKWKMGDYTLPDGSFLLYERPATNRRLGAQRLALLRDELAQHEPSVALALSLKHYPRGRASFQLTDDVLGTLLPHAQSPRAVSRILEFDCERLLHEGTFSAIPDRISAIFNAGAGLRDDPFLICLLVRIAGRIAAAQQIERALGMGELPEETCRTLMERVALERKENGLQRAVRGERAMWHLVFDNIERGRLTVGEFFARTDGNASSKPDLRLRLGGFLYSYRLFEDHAMMIGWFNQSIQITGLPTWEQQDAWNDLEWQVRAARAEYAPSKRMILSTLLLPAMNKVGKAAVRDQACLVCAETALAVERFRLTTKRWPKTLDELCPAWLPSVPLDPFTGEPLHYARKEDGVVIYSVGPDLQDDNGDVLRAQHEGNYDLGCRLFDPDKRNLPPDDDD